MQVHRLTMFAEWAEESALDAFLDADPFGRRLAAGWHVRLAFQRRWGRVAELEHLPDEAERGDLDAPAVAVTLARMRLTELPRFLHWGKARRAAGPRPSSRDPRARRDAAPMHRLHLLDLAQRPRHDRHGVGKGRRHLGEAARAAIAERERRDFHHEFTTLRFRPLAEHGTWDGRAGYVPGLG